MRSPGRRNCALLLPCLVEEPDSTLGFIQVNLEDAGGGLVAGLFGGLVYFSQVTLKGQVIGFQASEHVLGSDERVVIVLDAGEGSNVTDTADGGSPDLARSLGEDVDHRKELVGLFVEQ